MALHEYRNNWNNKIPEKDLEIKVYVRVEIDQGPEF
jgi:hypothetical protein